MIIIVQNNRINTDDIYQITPIECNHWFYNKIEIRFDILRYNVQPFIVSIELEGNDITNLIGSYPQDGKFTYDQIEKALNILKNKVKLLQDEIVSAWSNNQKEYPTFNFK